MTDINDCVPLESLDPASGDAGFWLRFHSRVLGDAQGELAQRRMSGDLNVIDVVFAWRKALVPITLLAAALAGILIVGNEPEDPVQMVALEEVLTEELNVSPTEGISLEDGDRLESLFAMVEGGF